MSQVRLLLADEQRLCLAALKNLLASEVRVVGTAASTSELLSQVERLAPSVVLFRLSLPDTDGLRALRAIRDRYPNTRVVVVAADASPQLPEKALSSGATACLLPTADPKTLLKAIHDAARKSSARGRAGESVREHPSAPPVLNPRQVEILTLIVDGLTQKQIAARLHISPKTVEFHKYRMMRNLGVKSTAELIVAGVRMGLGQ